MEIDFIDIRRRLMRFHPERPETMPPLLYLKAVFFSFMYTFAPGFVYLAGSLPSVVASSRSAISTFSSYRSRFRSVSVIAVHLGHFRALEKLMDF
jgi:hypothetical protein